MTWSQVLELCEGNRSLQGGLRRFVDLEGQRALNMASFSKAVSGNAGCWQVERCQRSRRVTSWGLGGATEEGGSGPLRRSWLLIAAWLTRVRSLPALTYTLQTAKRHATPSPGSHVAERIYCPLTFSPAPRDPELWAFPSGLTSEIL